MQLNLLYLSAQFTRWHTLTGAMMVADFSGVRFRPHFMLASDKNRMKVHGF